MSTEPGAGQSGSLTLQEALDAFHFSKWPDNNEKEWALKWWQYALDKNLDLRSPEWQQFQSTYGLNFSVDRDDVVRFVADGVIDRMQIPEN